MGIVHEDVRVGIHVDGAQDVARRLGAIENKIEKIGKEAKKAGRDMNGLGGMLKGVASVAAGIGFANIVKGVLDFDSALGQLQADIGMNNTEVMKLKDRILGLATAYGTTKEEVLGAYQTFQGFAGDISKYQDTMGQLVMTHKATGASLEDLAKLQATLTDSLLMSPDAAMQGIAALRAYANAGTIELSNMASELPQIMGGAAALGFTGQRGINQIGTALGVAGQAFSGKAEEARTSVNALFVEFQKKAKAFKGKLGIDVFNKDGSMRDLTTLMNEIAKKTGHGTARGGKGLVNFFGESSLKTVQTWMTMLRSGKVNDIFDMGQKGSFKDIETAYKTRMDGIASESEKLKKSMASLDEQVQKVVKTLLGVVGEDPGAALATVGGILAAPKIAGAATAAGGALSGAAAAGGLKGAAALAGQWALGPLAALAGGAAIGHYGVDRWLGKKMFKNDKGEGISISDAIGNTAVNKTLLDVNSKQYAKSQQFAFAREQALKMAGLESSGVRSFGGAKAIVDAAIKSQYLDRKSGNITADDKVIELLTKLVNKELQVSVKPAGGVDKLEAKSKRSKQ